MTRAQPLMYLLVVLACLGCARWQPSHAAALELSAAALTLDDWEALPSTPDGAVPAGAWPASAGLPAR